MQVAYKSVHVSVHVSVDVCVDVRVDVSDRVCDGPVSDPEQRMTMIIYCFIGRFTILCFQSPKRLIFHLDGVRVSLEGLVLRLEKG